MASADARAQAAVRALPDDHAAGEPQGANLGSAADHRARDAEQPEAVAGRDIRVEQLGIQCSRFADGPIVQRELWDADPDLSLDASRV